MNVSNKQYEGACPNCERASDLIIIVEDGEKSTTHVFGSGQMENVDVRVYACQHNSKTYFHQDIIEVDE